MAVPVFVSGPNDRAPAQEEKPVHNLYALLDKLNQEFKSDRQVMTFRVWISLAALLVYGIFRGLKASGYFPVADENLETVLGVGLSVVSLSVAGFVLLLTGLRAVKSLQSFQLNQDVSLSLALLIPSLALVWDLFFVHSHAAQQDMAGVLLALSFLIAGERFASGWFASRFWRLSGFRLENLAPKVKLLESDTPAPEAAVSRTFVAGQRERIVGASEIRAGDVFRLEKGDVVPCDARVLDGLARIDERRFSGRWQVRFKGRGSEIYGGSQLASGTVTCKALSTANDSSVTWFSKILDRALNQSLPSEREIRFPVDLFNLSILFLAALTAVAWLAQGADMLLAASCVAGVLTLAAFTRLFLLQRLLPVLSMSRLFLRGVLARGLKAFTSLSGLETFVLDTPEVTVGYRLKTLTGLDDRIDRERLGSVLLALFAASEERPFTMLAEELLRQFPSPEPFEVFDFISCGELGVCGKIGGVDFSAGVEEFLVQRGVYVEASDLETVTQGEELLYLAMGPEIIARLKFEASGLDSYRHLLGSLEKSRKRAFVCSQLDTEELRSNVREIGVSGAFFNPGLSVDAYRERLRSLSPAALLIPDPATRDIEGVADISISVFDEMRWNVEKSDMLLFSQDVSLVAEALEESTAAQLRQKIFMIICAVLGCLAATLAGFGILGAGWVAIIPLLSILGIQAWLFRVSTQGIPALIQR